MYNQQSHFKLPSDMKENVNLLHMSCTNLFKKKQPELTIDTYYHHEIFLAFGNSKNFNFICLLGGVGEQVAGARWMHIPFLGNFSLCGNLVYMLFKSSEWLQSFEILNFLKFETSAHPQIVVSCFKMLYLNFLTHANSG